MEGIVLKRAYRLLAIAGLIALAGGLTGGLVGCGLVNKLRAKNDLNDGVRSFNSGKYDLAEQRFQEAMELNPSSANAQLFYARAVNARFDQKMTPDFGLKALDAYEKIIARNQDNPQTVDKALAFESKVYDEMAMISPDKADEYKQKSRDTLLKRADLASADATTKAIVYYTIGQGYWQESYAISKLYTKTTPEGKLIVQTIPPEQQGKMRQAILAGLEYMQKALSVKPDYADAYEYQKLLYIEEYKIEMNPAKKQALINKEQEAGEQYKKYHDQQLQAAQAAGQ
jgi:tetratricopeptide (TPR) repeat protein